MMIIPRQKRFSVLEGIGEVVKRDLSSKNLISNPFISYPPGYLTMKMKLRSLNGMKKSIQELGNKISQQ